MKKPFFYMTVGALSCTLMTVASTVNAAETCAATANCSTKKECTDKKACPTTTAKAATPKASCSSTKPGSCSAASGCPDSQASAQKDPAMIIAEKCSFLPPVLATVNGEKVTRANFVSALSGGIPPQYMSQFTQAPEDMVKKQAQDFIDERIQNLAMVQQAKAAGFVPDAKTVLSDFNNWFSKMDEKRQAELKQHLTSQKKTVEQYAKELSEDKFYQERIAVKRLLDESLKEVNVGDSDISAYYASNKDNYRSKEEIHASYLVIKPADATPEADKAAKAKIEEAYAKIKAGADFIATTKEYTTCAKADGIPGDLGWFARGTYNQVFEEKAFKLKKGEYSEVVKNADGYQIITVLDRRGGEATALADVKEAIRQKLTDDKTETIISGLIEAGKKNITIDRAI